MVRCAHLICALATRPRPLDASTSAAARRPNCHPRASQCGHRPGCSPIRIPNPSDPLELSHPIRLHKFLETAVAVTMALACAHFVAAPSLLLRAAPSRRPALPRALAEPRSASARLRRRHWGVQSQSEKASGAAKAAAAEDEEAAPSWAKPGTEELPPWARNEAAAPATDSGDLPFPVYLIGSCLVAIAAVGSIFEYFNQNPLFGVVQPDNPLWAPILGVFAITGFPSAGFLFYKAISLANKASEEADRADGYDP